MAKGTTSRSRATTKKKQAKSKQRERASESLEQSRAFKDPLDLRDRMYEPVLVALPREVDNRVHVPRILDQGQEGACTGFGLAAVVNYLYFNHPDQADATEDTWFSPRMLYELAKRYDDWEGEDYDGSSIRAAMKAWNRHGVCEEQLWPHTRRSRRVTAKIQWNALRNPLGAYVRVRHLHLNHMHAALNEAGILLASASVHAGWDEVGPDGKIPYRPDDLQGGHAFAIVGYDRDGFWIQNSWGEDWGNEGFCHISYDDWLANGWDCWVARLGVPTTSGVAEGKVVSSRIATFDYIPHEAVVMDHIRTHYVNVGNDGKLSDSGRYATEQADVDEIFSKSLPEASATWTTPRLMLYAHGGLNSEKASASRIASFRDFFLGNEIYPLHFMWETGLQETLLNILSEAFRDKRFLGWRDKFKERFEDLLDEAIELAARAPGRRLWGEMKENAEYASRRGGAAELVAKKVAAWMAETPDAEVHLVGHSAGSIFHGNLIPVLAKLGVPVKSLTLFAPACTTELFKANVLPHLTKGVGRGEVSGPLVESCTVFNLSDKTERDDKVGPIYKKSLLYLVSEAFEPQKHTPLLGMQKFLDGDPAIAAALGKGVESENRCVITSRGVSLTDLHSASTSHGGFDNDELTLNSMLRIVTGKKKLTRPFPHNA